MVQTIAETTVPTDIDPSAMLAGENLDAPPADWPLSQKERAAVNDALIDIFGQVNRQRTKEMDKERRSELLGYGVAGGSDQPDGTVAFRASVNHGTMVIAEGTGSNVGVAVAARGFERAMRKETVRYKHLGSAFGVVRRASGKAQEAIDAAQRYLWPQGEDTSATLLGAQIVDDKLLYTGHRPLFVCGPDGHCDWLTRDTSPDLPAVGVHIFKPGRNIVIMSSGRDSDKDLRAYQVGQSVSELLDILDLDEPGAIRDMAEFLQSRLTNGSSAGTIMLGVVDVKPWKDQRSGWTRKADYLVRAPSTLAYWGLSKTLFRGRKRRELYETDSTAGKFGRGISRAADLLFDVGFLAGVATIARPVLTTSGHDFLPQLDGLFHHGPGTPPTHIDAAPDLGHSIDPAPATTPEPTPQATQPEQPPHLADTYPAQRVAIHQDPLASGKSSTVTNWSQDAIRHYAAQAGLTPAETDRLAHDPSTINRINNAFYDDTSNPNNAKVKYDAHHYMNAEDSYSQKAQGEAAREVIEDDMHKLGLEIHTNTPTPESDTLPIPAVHHQTPTLQATLLTPPTVPALNHARFMPYGLEWEYVAAIAALTATMGGGTMLHHRQFKKARSAARKEAASPLFVMPHGGRRERRLIRLGAMPSRSAGTTRPSILTAATPILSDAEDTSYDHWT